MGRGSKNMPKPHRTVFISNQFWPVRNFALEMRSDSFFLFLDFVCLLSGRLMGHRKVVNEVQKTLW